MRIVITGASGNVGTALLRKLFEADRGVEVVGVVRRPPEPVGVYRDVRWHGVDLADPGVAAGLIPLFDGADAVVHLAWGFQPTRNTAYLEKQGVGGTVAVLQAAHTAKVGHLLHMSSVGAYAPGRYCRRVDESWPATGIPSSPYSRNKSAAEARLDEYERQHGDAGVPITRMRPGFIVQRAAASGLMRYGLPGYVPMGLLHLLPILPLDRRLCIPLVHADDVADAFLGAIERRASGPFNLSAAQPLRRDDVAHVLGAKPVHVPAGVLGTLVDLSWRARLQPIDRGWLDMAFSVPLLDCTRAARELDWQPQWSPSAALTDLLDGVAQQSFAESPPLRRRSMLEQLRRDVTQGRITSRRLP
jgi:nucleoside-diphosphate-sugar epimerase